MALLAPGCIDDRAGITETQSLEVGLVSPADPGTVDRRLPDTERTVVVDLKAKTPENQVDTAFNGEVRVYAQFLGTLTPDLDRQPLATVTMVNGVATGQSITLPSSVFGPTTLWIDNGTGIGPEYEHGSVTGTSPTLWYRDPYIADLQTPRSETALDALSTSPLQDKQINVEASRYGARGRLIVTSTYAQGYTVSDVQCADDAGTPPCVANAYDHVLVYSFSAPRDQRGNRLEVGQTIDRFTGGQSEFNGLTEIGFPRTFAPEQLERDVARLPAPVPINPTPGVDSTWFGSINQPDGMINFERNESGPIEIRNAMVCALDQEYATYKQWKLDPSAAGSCSTRNLINVITSGTDFTTDPATLVGRRLPKVVGILRPVNIGSFNVWIIYPRGSSDLQLQ
ncbi:MAG: hypothetical protein ACTHU0_03280 [Kofleriaceae bacterium]